MRCFYLLHTVLFPKIYGPFRPMDRSFSSLTSAFSIIRLFIANGIDINMIDVVDICNVICRNGDIPLLYLVCNTWHSQLREEADAYAAIPGSRKKRTHNRYTHHGRADNPALLP